MAEYDHESRVCPVCLDVLTDSSTVGLHCGHEFHSECGVNYFRRTGDNQCPACRAPPPTVSEENWSKWSAIRNREARREREVSAARDKFWHVRKQYAEKKKKVAKQCAELCKIRSRVVLYEEAFDTAVLDSLQHRNSRVLNYSGL